MGEEESKLLQVAQITVLRLYTLSPKSFYLVWGQWRLAQLLLGISAGTLDSDSVMGPDASEPQRVLRCFFGNPKMI